MSKNAGGYDCKHDVYDTVDNSDNFFSKNMGIFLSVMFW